MRPLTIGLMLISLPAFACPNLAGKYATCRSQSGNGSGAYDLEVKQTVKSGVTTYTFASTDADTHERGTETYVADGKNRVKTERDPDTGMELSLATQVSCVGNAVKSKMVLTFGNEMASSLETTVTRQGNVLTQVTVGSNMGEEINETVTCQ